MPNTSTKIGCHINKIAVTVYEIKHVCLKMTGLEGTIICLAIAAHSATSLLLTPTSILIIKALINLQTFHSIGNTEQRNVQKRLPYTL